MFKSKFLLDVFWSFADNILQQMMNFVVGIVLARLLMPEEFGLVGIVTVFITFSNVFVDGGFSAALINKNQADDIDYNTVFYTNFAISILIYLVLWGSAGFIADFYTNSEIASLLRLSGVNILLIALSTIHRTILIRNLNFKLITVISLIAVSVSSVCAIFLAYRGFGVYSLIYRILIGQFITVLLFWILNKWRPRLVFSKSSFRALYNYGVNLFFSNLLNKIHANVYYLIIGKFFSPIQLGYYTRATTFRDLASTNISATIQRVSFSTLSKIEDAQQQLKKFFQFVNLAYVLTTLTMVLLFFCAKEIVLILLSEKWLPSVEILRIMSIAGLFLAMYNLNLDFLAVLRKTKIYLRIEIFAKILIIPIIFIGIKYGFVTFLWAVVAHSIVMFVILLFILREINIKGVSMQIILAVRYILIFGCLFFIDKYLVLDFNLYWSILLKGCIALIVFIVLNYKQIKGTLTRTRNIAE